MTDALMTAEKLLQTGAVKLSPNQPYTWASGWKSPIYCDNRKLLSNPYTRDYIKSELCNLVFDKFPEAEVIAGVATAGIPWGALVADQLKLSFVYVRPKPKEHGMGNQVEGDLKTGQKVVIMEDLVSTGVSSLQVASLLKSTGSEVIGMAAIFNYDFSQTTVAFEKAGVTLYSLTNYPTLVELAAKKGVLTGSEEEVLLKWRSDPSGWVPDA
ncbi:MAG: orotate phosphoribosyltransferase [Chitinophagaceae bacterium]